MQTGTFVMYLESLSYSVSDLLISAQWKTPKVYSRESNLFTRAPKILTSMCLYADPAFWYSSSKIIAIECRSLYRLSGFCISITANKERAWNRRNSLIVLFCDPFFKLYILGESLMIFQFYADEWRVRVDLAAVYRQCYRQGLCEGETLSNMILMK